MYKIKLKMLEHVKQINYTLTYNYTVCTSTCLLLINLFCTVIFFEKLTNLIFTMYFR